MCAQIEDLPAGTGLEDKVGNKLFFYLVIP